MSLTAIIALALASFIWMVAPGPGVFATPARSMAFGFRSNLPTFTDLSALTFTSGDAIVATPLTVLPGVLVKYPLAATQLRRFFCTERTVRFMNRYAGSIMIGAGCAVAARN